MVLTTIFLTRHGARSNWTTDPRSGIVTTHIRSPTGIPTDPPLSASGVVQARELGEIGAALDPPVIRVYSSPFYRCLQTISPLWSNVCAERDGGNEVPFICDRGLGEWFGQAPFEHLGPAHLNTLQRLFPSIQESTSYIPPAHGEGLGTLHDRCAAALARIISDVDKALASASSPASIIICSHAAPLITMGRALTGIMPADANTEDFDTWTCGVSRFERRAGPAETEPAWTETDRRNEKAIPRVADFAPGGHLDWRDGRGVGGGWVCTVNSDTAHLSGGPVRNWHFNGDEAFVDTSGVLVRRDEGPEGERERGAKL